MDLNKKIQQASNHDCQQIKQLIYSVLLEYGLNPDPQQTDLDLEDIDLHYTNNHGYFGILRSGQRANDSVIATVGLRKVNATTCELRKMYMAPNIRGRGLGKQLLQFALTKAATLGYQHVTLETASPLVEAIALYKNYGFKEFFPEHLSNRCDQAYELEL